MRGKVEIETLRGEREAIVVSEIPYQVNKAAMVERIGELVREKKIDGIAALRDESDRQGMRIVIELKRDAMADVVLNQLYRFTPLQTSFGANMVALDGGRPLLMNLKDMLTAFVHFREEVVSRRLVASPHTPVLFLPSRGRVYKEKVWRLPIAAPQSRGKPLINILPIQQG